MVAQTSHQWDGEVHVSYQLAISPDRFRGMVSTPESPFEVLTGVLPNEYYLKHKRHQIGHLTSGPAVPLEEQLAENCIGVEIIAEGAKRLGFEPTYGVGQEWDYRNPDTMQVYRDLRDLLEKQDIPYFIVVEDEGPKTTFIAGGHNPEKELKVDNRRPDIFPL